MGTRSSSSSARPRAERAPSAPSALAASVGVALALVVACASASRPRRPSRALGFPSACARAGALHFTALGAMPAARVEALAARYRRAYRVPVTVLPPVPAAAEAFDRARGQYEASALLAAVERAHAATLSDPSARVLAVATEDQYIATRRWRYAFAAYGERVAVVSTARMDPAFYGDQADRGLVDARLHRMVTRVLAGIYCGLPRRGAPDSVLRPEVLSLDDLDVIDESVW
ncbi:MAG: hypothetical protein HY909_27015 [Deltaproteobacteria bacterium]|nr:hypothetical protein [Deltaproteobacteria bacterium]